MQNLFIEFKDFTKNYKLIRKIKCGELGEISLMKNLITKQIVQVKEEKIENEEVLNEILLCLTNLLTLNECPFFNIFLGFTINQIKPMLNQKNFFTIFMIYEYNVDNLESLIEETIKKEEIFEETFIWNIMEGIINCIVKLMEIDKTHGDLNMKNIFISKNLPKIIFTNYHLNALERIKMKQTQYFNCFLAPEQLILMNNSPKTMRVNTKTEIFSIGIIILNLCSLNNNERIYNIYDPSINENSIFSKLNEVNKLYSSDLFILLRNMLEINELLRPSSIETLDYIIKRRNNIPISSKFLNNKVYEQIIKTPISKRKKFDRCHTSSNNRRNINSSTEKILNESKSTKRTDKTNISYKELYFEKNDLNNNNNKNNELNFFDKIKLSNKKKQPETPIPQLERWQKMNFSSKKKNPILISSKKTGKKKVTNYEIKSTPKKNKVNKINFDKILQNVRTLEKKIILDPSGAIKSNISKKQYGDGSIYLGNLKNNKREGKGIYYFTHYEVYGGDWNDDKFHGKGVYLFDNGDIYDGLCYKGAKHGVGIYYYENGERYDGEWSQNSKNGFGIFYYNKNERFEGQWLNNEKNGKGVYYFQTGDKFEGIWENGKKSGKGIVYFADKSIFEGVWKENLPNGLGVLKYANGDTFKGNYVCGVKEGEGIYIHEVGCKYEGVWKDDDQNGKGLYNYTNGDTYKGFIVNGDREGFGEYIYSSNGEKYIGEWKENLRHGKGKLILSSKSFYEGSWKDGKRDGFGLMIYENGDKYEGFWKKDKKYGKGCYFWAKGEIYDGEWKDDKMNGEGLFKNEIGLETKGIWYENEMID